MLLQVEATPSTKSSSKLPDRQSRPRDPISSWRDQPASVRRITGDGQHGEKLRIPLTTASHPKPVVRITLRLLTRKTPQLRERQELPSVLKVPGLCHLAMLVGRVYRRGEPGGRLRGSPMCPRRRTQISLGRGLHWRAPTKARICQNRSTSKVFSVFRLLAASPSQSSGPISSGC